MRDAPRAVQEMVAGLIASFHRDNLSAEKRAAVADPLGHKNTRVFDKGMSYRYFSCVNRKGQSVLFCYSVHRNVAGFFLGWREVRQRSGKVKRDMFLSRRVKKRCIEIARRRAEALRAKVKAAKPPAPLV